MISLNLIPQDRKALHLKMHIHQVIRYNLFLLFMTISIISAALLLGRLYLENRFIATIADTSKANITIQYPVTQKVKSSNALLKIAKEIQDEFTPWHKLLITLGELTPQDVTLRQITIAQDTETLKILGHAADRSSFLKFKDNLDEQDLFVTVESPISNILDKININFSLSIMLNTKLLE